MSKKPFLYAIVAAVYIVLVVLVINFIDNSQQPQMEESILMPMAALGLFVLSAAVMAFLFLSEPLYLFLNNQKKEALEFFGKTLGTFAAILLIFLIFVFAR